MYVSRCLCVPLCVHCVCVCVAAAVSVFRVCRMCIRGLSVSECICVYLDMSLCVFVGSYVCVVCVRVLVGACVCCVSVQLCPCMSVASARQEPRL